MACCHHACLADVGKFEECDPVVIISAGFFYDYRIKAEKHRKSIDNNGLLNYLHVNYENSVIVQFFQAHKAC